MSGARDLIEPLKLAESLPVGSAQKRSGGWWGVWSMIVTEGALFGYLLFAYFYLYAQSTQSWPPEGLPKLGISGFSTAILLSSSVFVWLGEKSVKRGRNGWGVFWLAATIAAGAVFTGIQWHDWSAKAYGPAGNLYGSLYFTVTGFHLLHVVVGLIILLVLMLWTALGFFGRDRHAALAIGGLYWHFVDAVWLFVFTSFYLVPYLPGGRG